VLTLCPGGLRRIIEILVALKYAKNHWAFIDRCRCDHANLDRVFLHEKGKGSRCRADTYICGPARVGQLAAVCRWDTGGGGRRGFGHGEEE